MTECGEYEVTGSRQYRGHDPGTIFEAVLEPAAEARAIARGDIRVVRKFTPDLRPGSYTYPDGWDPPPESAAPVTTRGADRRLSH